MEVGKIWMRLWEEEVDHDHHLHHHQEAAKVRAVAHHRHHLDHVDSMMIFVISSEKNQYELSQFVQLDVLQKRKFILSSIVYAVL